MDDAKTRVKQLAATSPGHYFIFDAVNMDFISEGVAPEHPPEKRYEPPAFRQIRVPPTVR